MKLFGSLGLTLSLTLCVSPAVAADDAAADDGITVLARGPVHEAFAAPTSSKPEPGPIAPKKPPAPVPEVPPDEKPKGQDVQWIPGYWAWDLETKDFLWVSGVWRAPPPNRKWLPGYWSAVDDGYQWTAGFWAPAAQTDLQYRDAPPATLDNGPNTPDPEEASGYVPGLWLWRDGAWVWQPGSWKPYHANWTWTPACYNWTPNGYAFNSGYWDYPLEDRGLLFAPVSFSQPLWDNPGWSFTPSYCVNTGGLFSSLFFGPGFGNYCFGNYYGPFWRANGFRSWSIYGPRFHDSLYGHAAWSNRVNPGWGQGLRNDFNARFNNPALRPARTLAGQNALLRQGNNTNVNNLRLVSPLNQLGARTPLTRLSQAQRTQERTAARDLQQASQARRGSETTAGRLGAPGRAGVGRLEMPAQAGLNQRPAQAGNAPGAGRTSLNPGQNGPGTTMRPSPGNPNRPLAATTPTPGGPNRPQGTANPTPGNPNRPQGTANPTPGNPNRPPTGLNPANPQPNRPPVAANPQSTRPTTPTTPRPANAAPSPRPAAPRPAVAASSVMPSRPAPSPPAMHSAPPRASAPSFNPGRGMSAGGGSRPSGGGGRPGGGRR